MVPKDYAIYGTQSDHADHFSVSCREAAQAVPASDEVKPVVEEAAAEEEAPPTPAPAPEEEEKVHIPDGCAMPRY